MLTRNNDYSFNQLKSGLRGAGEWWQSAGSEDVNGLKKYTCLFRMILFVIAKNNIRNNESTGNISLKRIATLSGDVSLHWFVAIRPTTNNTVLLFNNSTISIESIQKNKKKTRKTTAICWANIDYCVITGYKNK